MTENLPLKYRTNKEQFIFICLKLLDFEIRQQYDITKTKGYLTIINTYLFRMFQALKKRNYQQIILDCDECMSLIKFIDGNHYRIWLFYKVQQKCLDES